MNEAHLAIVYAAANFAPFSPEYRAAKRGFAAGYAGHNEPPKHESTRAAWLIGWRAGVRRRRQDQPEVTHA